MMFETMIAFCIATDIAGAPVSRCWIGMEGTKFDGIVACRQYAEFREAQVMSELVAKYELPPVVSVVCGPIGEAS